MKKLLLSLLLVTLFSNNSVAQDWTYYKDLPLNTVPIDIDYNNSGTLFMITKDQKLYYKLLNGNWTEITNFPTNNGHTISAVKNSQTIYVGDFTYGGIFKSSNFGASWQHLWATTGSTTGFHEAVSELSNIRNPNLFYGADAYDTAPYIIKYTSAGQVINFLYYDPTFNSDNSAYTLYITANNKLLIGTYNGGIFLTQDNGASFTHTNQSEHRIFKFTEDANGRVYALGYRFTDNKNFIIFSDDYINWTTMPLPDDTIEYTTLCYQSTTNSLWLGSESGIQTLQLSQTTPSWTNASFNNGLHNVIEIVADNSGRLYDISLQKLFQRLNTTNNGWTSLNTGLTGNVTSIDFDENNKLYASSYSTPILSSATSATAPWVNNLVADDMRYTLQQVVTKPNGRVFAIAGLKLKKSIDSGLTYSDITPPSFQYTFARFVVGEAGDLFAVHYSNENVLWWSQDEGETWSILKTFPLNSFGGVDPISSISQDSNGVIYVRVSSVNDPVDYYKIYLTTNNGLTWETRFFSQLLYGGSTTFNLGFYSKNNLTLVGIYNKVYKYDYTNVSNPLTLINPPQGIAFSVFSPGFKVDNQGTMYLFSGNLYFSTDLGNSWTNLGKPDTFTSDWSGPIMFDNQNRVYVVANDSNQVSNISDRGIYYVSTTLGNNDFVNELNITISPNPSKDFIYLETSIEIAEIKVYDSLGKDVTSAVSISNKEINITQLSNGLYILKLKTEENEYGNVRFIKN